MQRVWFTYLLLFCIALLAVAPIVYLACYALNDYPLGDAISALVEQYTAARQNPLKVSLLSGAPFLLLASLVGIARWRGAGLATCQRLVLGGGGAILIVLTWAHFEFWPNYLPGVEYPGFPHGLELVIAPLYFAPVAMVAGAFLGWLAGRQS